MNQSLVRAFAIAVLLGAPAMALQKGQPHAAAPVAQPASGHPEIFHGGLVNTMTTRGNGTVPFELHLDAYTSDADMDRLAGLESRKGVQALVDELYRNRLGFIRIGETLGYPVSVARRVSGPHGDTIYAVMDRPLQLYELWNNTPSRDYPFSVAEIQVGRDGKLSGDLYPIAMVDLLGRGSLHITQQLAMPFRLIGLERSK